MEKKQCTKCKHFLLFKCFTNNKKSQLTKCCVKCLNRSRQQTKCKHESKRSKCKDYGGKEVCEHNKQRSQCKDCGGSQICEHNKRRPTYKDCGGGHICEHKKRRSLCKDCNPVGHFADVARSRVYTALKNDKGMSYTEYLGRNIETFKKHIEQQLTEGMSWENYGE